MATDARTVEFIMEQIQAAGNVRSLKMFGEYGLYCNEKIVALICDDQLFIKPTLISNQFLDDTNLAPPYPGAKNYYRVPEDNWDDTEWLVDFIRQTADQLPAPKPKIRKPKV